jgi:hypothetical protein
MGEYGRFLEAVAEHFLAVCSWDNDEVNLESLLLLLLLGEEVPLW